jgi:hypothetical protein
VIENGAGDLARSPLEVLEVLAHWLMNDGQLLAERASRAAQLGRPMAAYDVAKIVWRAAETHQPHHMQRRTRLKVIDMLSRAQVRWQADEEGTEDAADGND